MTNYYIDFTIIDTINQYVSIYDKKYFIKFVNDNKFKFIINNKYKQIKQIKQIKQHTNIYDLIKITYNLIQDLNLYGFLNIYLKQFVKFINLRNINPQQQMMVLKLSNKNVFM